MKNTKTQYTTGAAALLTLLTMARPLSAQSGIPTPVPPVAGAPAPGGGGGANPGTLAPPPPAAGAPAPGGGGIPNIPSPPPARAGGAPAPGGAVNLGVNPVIPSPPPPAGTPAPGAGATPGLTLRAPGTPAEATLSAGGLTLRAPGNAPAEVTLEAGGKPGLSVRAPGSPGIGPARVVGAAPLSAEEIMARDAELEVFKAHLQVTKSDIALLEQAANTGTADEQQKDAAKLKALKAFRERLEGNIRKLEQPAPIGGKSGDKRDLHMGYRPIQAVGEPDAGETGAASLLAWHPRPSDSGKEWLGLIYEHPVEVAEIRIHNISITGALARVTSCVRGSKDGVPGQPDRVIWEGQEPSEKTPAVRVITVSPGVTANALRLEFDTTRAKKFQQIDAVELVGRDGSRQWAKASEASSHYTASGLPGAGGKQ